MRLCDSSGIGFIFTSLLTLLHSACILYYHYYNPRRLFCLLHVSYQPPRFAFFTLSLRHVSFQPQTYPFPFPSRLVFPSSFGFPSGVHPFSTPTKSHKPVRLRAHQLGTHNSLVA